MVEVLCASDLPLLHLRELFHASCASCSTVLHILPLETLTRRIHAVQVQDMWCKETW
jgi:hypothetical protein